MEFMINTALGCAAWINDNYEVKGLLLHDAK
jgi:hypothetical protein